MKTFSLAVICAALVAAPGSSAAQRPSDLVQLHLAVVRTVLEDAPPTPYLLLPARSEDSAVVALAGKQLRLPVRHARSAEERRILAGADTVLLTVNLDTLEDQRAVATVVTRGRMPITVARRSKYSPSSWFEIKRIVLSHRGGAWKVERITTIMES